MPLNGLSEAKEEEKLSACMPDLMRQAGKCSIKQGRGQLVRCMLLLMPVQITWGKFCLPPPPAQWEVQSKKPASQPGAGSSTVPRVFEESTAEGEAADEAHAVSFVVVELLSSLSFPQKARVHFRELEPFYG